MESDRADAIPLGAFRFWLMFRLVQLLFAAVVAVKLLSPGPLRMDAAIPLLGLAAVAIGFHPQAYGFANADGITFRRYFWRRRIAWRDVGLLKTQTFTNVQSISVRFDTAWPWSRVEFLHYATAPKAKFREQAEARAASIESLMDMGQRWNLPLS